MSAPSLEGLLLVDKPPGPTSHDVVGRVRHACNVRRVGHAGTLDPTASGLLPLVLGRATRLVRFLPSSPKTYRGTLRLGRSTTTDDEAGEVVAEHGGPLPAPAEVLAAASEFVGRHSQVPPAFSARRVAGRRLYDLARRGVALEAPASEIEVARFDLVPTDAPDLYRFVTEVSAGTYVRGLARDLGRKLGCGGILATLVRTRIGPMRLEDAHPLPAAGSPGAGWVREGLIPIDDMPLSPPAVRLDDDEAAQRFRQGAAVSAGASAASAGPVRVVARDGTLLGIAEAEGGALRPRVVLPAPGAPR